MTATTSAATGGSPATTTPDAAAARAPARRREGRPGPVGTGSRGTRIVGLAALASVALLALYGLVISPPDAEMADNVRIMYVHVPSATYLYLGCFTTTLASAMWLWKRTPGWDALAEAGAEIGLVFAVLTLVTGSLWGRPTWGSYWEWDARLTSTAVLTALLVGYLALRRLDVDPDARSVRAAVLGLLLVPNVIVVNRSVEWWRSIHQDATVARIDPDIKGDMFVALGFGFLALGLILVWLMIHRFRLAWLEQQADRIDLDAALADRRAEAVGSGASSGPASGAAGARSDATAGVADDPISSDTEGDAT